MAIIMAPVQTVATTITVDLHKPVVDVDAPLDARDIEIVQQTFALLSRLGSDSLGKVIFMKLYAKAPNSITLFSYKGEGRDPSYIFRPGSPATMHAMKFVATLGIAVSLLKDMDTLVPLLQALGLKHDALGIMPGHYAFLGKAFLEALELLLGDTFTENARNAWTKVYVIIKTTMEEAVEMVAEPDAKAAA
eukprot:TRINITY_DN20195_c0_g1_i1.p1 TRINITY_DN20195_c0_g1~~TRINITY_DN20195_c0_g1_i1.p1  ORF type:complete len:191 (+),score=34.80 TRINITY_DN20195_c0_g1_i1:138-710(+)